MTTKKLVLIKNIFIGILLVIFGGIVIHAPLSVGLGALFPDFALLIKSWKELLMLVAGVLAVILIRETKSFRLFRNPIVIASLAYIALHLLLLFNNFENSTVGIAGLMIDLRYIAFFLLVYVATNLFPDERKLFLKAGIIGALAVTVFALLQIFVLPHDFLKYIGYGKDTISPYLTVDQNSSFIRINSTLRGPNPLGAYAVMVLSILIAALAKRKIKKKMPDLIAAVLLVGGLAALWSSYSRSALIAAVLAVGIVLSVTYKDRISPKLITAVGVMVFLIAGGLFLMRDSAFVSNVFFHDNPNDINGVNSNEGHANSLREGLSQIISQPLGSGIGSTGSASLYREKAVVVENQYLFVAREAGWFGLLLFVSIFNSILIKLWDYRRDWVALGLFASGIGLALIGLLLPVWVDDTVSIIWWGLSAIFIIESGKIKSRVEKD